MTKQSWRATPEQIAAMNARRRAKLSETSPILCARCPDAQLRLFDFSIEVANGAPVTDDGLRDAAEATLYAVQDELRARSSPLDLSVVSDLAFGRLWAIYALLFHTGSHSHAKRFELEITDGAPLAICLGTGPWFPPVAGFRRTLRVRTHWKDVWVPACGCNAIMPESTRLGGVMWRYWCHSCAPNTGAKGRAQARRHKRLVDEIHKSR